MALPPIPGFESHRDSRGHDGVIATLVHINGPTGAGKSAIAERLVEERPLALCLDIDALRVRLGQWRERHDSKTIARYLGFALVRRHLEDGHDVVLPQLIVREDVVADLERLATAAGASFAEVVLRADPGELAARVEYQRPSGESADCFAVTAGP